MRLRFQRGRPDNLETLHPAYFGMVMATGIVAIATMLCGVPIVPIVLFWLNAAIFAVLLVATGMRAVRYPGAFLADIRDHNRGVGFFTLVAAFGIFGNELVIQMQAAVAAVIFWAMTAVLWFVVTYGILAVLTVKPDKPGLTHGINGGWLVIVVATQSISILTVLILPAGVSADFHARLMFAALALWLGGGALYMWLMTLIFFRYTFRRMSAEDLTPPYWINMGAVAISTLAGATLLREAALSPTVIELAPFVKGFTLLFWAIGSWWIPMLLVLGVWRYIMCGVPFAYDPLYWGGVFPLGMYSVCTRRLAEVLNISFLMPVSTAFVVLAALAWLATFAGLIDSRLGVKLRA
ncbi:MAG TPA: tellurite resistance/C4-dicarboxylate transporter family protein [Pseudolabrys sp.]|nr:tellurite resistance/C4-dicarboxylate transporter family protein [Pseudolabrys sp.]